MTKELENEIKSREREVLREIKEEMENDRKKAEEIYREVIMNEGLKEIYSYVVDKLNMYTEQIDKEISKPFEEVDQNVIRFINNLCFLIEDILNKIEEVQKKYMGVEKRWSWVKSNLTERMQRSMMKHRKKIPNL